MKGSLLISLLFITLALESRTQSFEGTITYSVEFELKGEFIHLRDQIFEKLRNEGGYYDTIKVYIKEGKYKKVDNNLHQKSVIYLPEQNKIYSLEKGSEFVSIFDANNTTSIKLNLPEPVLVNVDSVKFINGIPCNILKLSWGNLGEEWYFFNRETAVVDPDLYAGHNYEYLNKILKSTESYPLEIVKSMNNVISIRMTLVSIEESELPEDIFGIPDLKKANKKMTKMIDDITGTQVMKIKN
ncbi:MAG: hypothetical protein WBA74_13045 [Cyclobacteriaceae bacterium]